MGANNMGQLSSLGMGNDIKLTARIALVAIGIGFIFVWAQQYLQGSPNGESIFYASMWSLACLAVGGLIGFLFGIPRWLQTDAPAAVPTQSVTDSTSGTTTNPPSTPAAEARRSRTISPNTNLDRIS